jgi:hypothetical protein
MKVSRIVTAAMLSILLPTLSVFAKNKSELHVMKAFNVGDQLVPAGDYTLEWDNTMLRERQVMKIIKRNNVVATVRGEWVTLERRSPDDALVVSNAGGVRILLQIRFKGKDQALEVSRESLANKNGGADHSKTDPSQ